MGQPHGILCGADVNLEFKAVVYELYNLILFLIICPFHVGPPGRIEVMFLLLTSYNSQLFLNGKEERMSVCLKMELLTPRQEHIGNFE